MRITIGPPAKPICDYRFTVGATPVAGLAEVALASKKSGMLINSGAAPIFRYDVLFQPLRGALGFAAY